MGIIWACAAILVVALVFGVRWSRLPFASPPPIDEPSAGEVARRYAWYCSLLLGAGVAAGVGVMGTGGRLAMRLLAVTAGDDAQGRITEADEIVGEITVDGTIGFVVFIGVFAGLIAATAYLVLRRLLPAGWLGGLAFGAGLLVVLGTTADPLREENPDFDIVGPGWLSVLVFTALALAYGVVLAGFVNRLSIWLPLPSTDRSAVLRYLPIVAIGVIAFTVTWTLVVVGLIVVLLTRWPPTLRAVRSPAALLTGRLLLAALVLVSLPGALAGLADIAGRGPS